MHKIFAVFPKALQAVKVAFLVAEDMDDYVGIVEDSPPALSYSVLAPRRNAVLLFKLFVKIFSKRLYVSFRRTARNYEIITQARLALNAEIDYALSLFGR